MVEQTWLNDSRWEFSHQGLPWPQPEIAHNRSRKPRKTISR